MKSKQELYEKVTARIVEALESGADGSKWSAPWHASTSAFLPTNVASKKPYRGVNVFALWAEQQLNGFSSNQWGTFKQWAVQAKDADGNLLWHDAPRCLRPVLTRSVRKGEKGTTVLLWKPTKRTVKNDKGEDERQNSLFATSYTVFNADQVEGYEAPDVEARPEVEVIAEAEAFFAELGADVRHGGNRAAYFPAGDRIDLPLRDDFVDGVAYYATSAHEHTHWTGHTSRCDRDLTGRFGESAYAAEELVAELGSAYVCGLLGLANEPREDHAHYIASWITLLKSDPSAIVTAASKAQQAVDYLVAHAAVDIDVEESEHENGEVLV